MAEGDGDLAYDLQQGHAQQAPYSFHPTVNGGHGRIETRRCWAIGGEAYQAYVDPTGQWPGLPSLIRVEAERRLGDTVQTPRCYLIRSRLPPARRLWRQEQTYPVSFARKRRRTDRDPDYLTKVLGVQQSCACPACA